MNSYFYGDVPNQKPELYLLRHFLQTTGQQRLLAVCCFFLTTIAPAASINSAWYARVWESDEGLPNNNVTALAQTPDGYLWVATESHLARFDGNQFEEFYQNNFAPGHNQRISAFVAAHDGSLWLPMDHGALVHLKNGDAEIFTNNLPNMTVENAVEDRDGAIWISYRNGELCCVRNGKIIQFSNRDGLPATRGDHALVADSAGQFWLAQRGQLFRFHNGRFDFIAQLPNFTTQLSAARDGGLWICSGNELLKYETSGLKEIGKLNPEPANAQPTAVLESRDGAIWIGTSSSGLFRFDGVNFENIPTSHRDILSLLEDNERNLWVGTAGGGLNRIQPRAIELQSADSGLPFETVQSLCEDTTGTIWAVTQNGFLVNRTNQFWKIVPAMTNWPANAVICIAAGRAGDVWIGGRSRIYHLHGDNFEIFSNGINNHIVRAILPAANGDLWLGGDTLEKFRDGIFTPMNLPANVQIIRALAEDKSGNIWAGSANGSLLCVTNGKIFDETIPVFGAPDSIRTLQAADDGSLWIGFANDGLGRLKNGKFFRFSAAQGLDDETISQIVPDKLGWIWLGADHGIFKIQQKELDAVADGKISRVQSVHYGHDEGLRSLQTEAGFAPGALCARDGHVWIPLRSALACIDPSRLPDNLDPPPVLLTHVTVDDQTLATYGGVMPVGNVLNLQTAPPAHLPAGHHRLEFEFTALNLATPENMQFRYKLVGVDDDWIDGKNQRSASYPGLAAGHYRFEVTARKNGGDWNPKVASFEFFIQPFFWETWWFKCVVLILFTAVVIAIGRYVSFRRLRRKLQTLEQQAALEHERARIAKDIHDDLGGSLTHTALLLNLALQDRNAPEKTGAHVQQAAAAVRQVTESIDEIVWAANPRNDTLADLMDYISLFAVQFLEAANIRCRIDLPKQFSNRPLSPEIRHSLFLVVKESLNNVVRHAEANEVHLQILVTDESLKINVADDGRGFDGESQNQYCSDGLKNMKQRMAEIGGQFFVESKPDSGTRISAVYFWPRK